MKPLAALLAAPVVDIDGTFFVQGGIYVLLIFILKPLLFTPWLEARDRRKEAVAGSLARAKTLATDADALVAKYDERLDAARDKAHGVRADARREQEAKKAASLAAARDAAQSDLDQARRRIDTEASKAREDLSARVDDLAGTIAQKILGRAS
jgi:F-type H+-transporting ATPase subunit b